jgi:hypothetical protein
MYHISQNKRKEFEWNPHKEMMKVEDDGYANYYELITTQPIYESKHCIVSHKCVQILHINQNKK